jgi:metalloendopeptidase OMA1, mitochondrial
MPSAVSTIRHQAHDAWNVVSSTAHNVAYKVHEVIVKVLDFVLPRNPVTKRREFRFVPRCVENALGASLFASLCPAHKTCSDPALVERVNRVFQRVVAQCDRKDLKFEIRVQKDDRTVNAFCAPGGKVIITTAMLKKLQEHHSFDKEYSEVTLDDKIAAVLGHEITHAAAGHGAKAMQVGLLFFLVGKIGSIVIPRLVLQRRIGESQISYENRLNLMGFALDLGWRFGSFFIKQDHSRHNEYEADEFGIKYAAKAGYNPEGALWLQNMLMSLEKRKGASHSEFLEFFKTHPNSDKRLEANKKTVDAILQFGVDKVFP